MAGKIKESKVASVSDTMSVASKILAEFADSIAPDQELPGVSERLKKALIEERDFSETALRQALFGDATL